MIFALALVFMILGILCLPPLFQALEYKNYFNATLAIIVIIADATIAITAIVVGLMQEFGV